MNNLSKREIVLLSILFVAILGAVYYNFVLKPFLADREEINMQIDDCQTAISNAKMKTAAIASVEKQMEDINAAMGDKLANVLDSIDRPAIIVLLEKTIYPEAENSTLSFSPDYRELGSNYITTVTASFSCTGKEFLQILTKLRTNIPISRVVESSLRIVNEATGECEASITIEVLTTSIVPTNTEFNYK